MRRLENQRSTVGRGLLCAVLLFLPSIATAGARLDPAALEYLGSFKPPKRQGAGVAGEWSWGMYGMTLIPDCLGRPDPTPEDGFPGCLGGFGHESGWQFGAFDLVPPGGHATQVVPFYELGAPIAEQQLGRDGTRQYFDVLYDRVGDACRIWWTYGTTFVGAKKDPPFLGYSSCDPARPDPQGVWDFGRDTRAVADFDDPFHTAKMYQALSMIPLPIADRLFDGKRLALGLSRDAGSYGGSQGPSLYVRHARPPSEEPPGPVMDATPLLWYRFTAYNNWYDKPQLRGPVVTWLGFPGAPAAEFVSTPSGEAVVMPWREPTVDRDAYPCSDPTAYRDDDPLTPDPCEVPVCWYGMSQCKDGVVEKQQPSFWDRKADGSPMPVDCRISDTERQYTGVHCLNAKTYFIFYDLEQLARVYRGESAHNEPQPYAKTPIDFDGRYVGSAYDPQAQMLYLSQGRNTPAVHVFKIHNAIPEGAATPSPDPR